MAELVGDDVLIELIGIAGATGKVAENVNAGRQLCARSTIVFSTLDLVEGRADIAGVRAKDVVRRRPVVRTPKQIQVREHGVRIRAQHELFGLIDRIEDRKRRCSPLAVHIARAVPTRRSVQVASCVGRAGAERFTIERIERIAVRVVQHAEIPIRRGTRSSHLSLRAHTHVSILRNGQAVVAGRIRARRSEDRAGARIDNLDGDSTSRRLDRVRDVESLVEFGLERHSIESDATGNRYIVFGRRWIVIAATAARGEREHGAAHEEDADAS